MYLVCNLLDTLTYHLVSTCDCFNSSGPLAERTVTAIRPVLGPGGCSVGLQGGSALRELGSPSSATSLL